MPHPRTILITGCSHGGLGDSLAREFNRLGHNVIATARNPARIAHLKEVGIETMILDVLSEESIHACVAAVAEKTGGGLDMLINNSGGGYSIPVIDAERGAFHKLFELNVWTIISVTQAFVPLLRQASGVLVNNTSIASVCSRPMAGVYNASKAAAAMLTDNLRLELGPLGIRVVELKTGLVSSKFYENQSGGSSPTLPADSIYNIAKEEVEKAMSDDLLKKYEVGSDEWAAQVAAKLLESPPPERVWEGGNAWTVWFARRFMPHNFLDSALIKAGAMDAVERNLNRPGKA